MHHPQDARCICSDATFDVIDVLDVAMLLMHSCCILSWMPLMHTFDVTDVLDVAMLPSIHLMSSMFVM